jgi:hypothetical protein
MESSGRRKGFIGLLGIGLFVLSSCAGSSSFMKPSTERAPLMKDKAVVRFMRPSSFGFAININVLDKEKTIGNSVAKSQFDYSTDPGRHLFIASAENQDYLEADLEAGNFTTFSRTSTPESGVRVLHLSRSPGGRSTGTRCRNTKTNFRYCVPTRRC